MYLQDLSGLSMCISKQMNRIISDGQLQSILFNVLALEKILVALTREIGDGRCFCIKQFSG